MTSRERIVAAINHREPDRAPVDFGGTVVTGLAAGVIPHLRVALGLDKAVQPVKVFEPVQMLGEITGDLRESLHCDCVGIFGTSNRFGFKNEDWKEWTMFDGTRVLVPGKFNTDPDMNGDIVQYPRGDKTLAPSSRMPAGGLYFDAIVRQKPIDEDKLDPADNVEEFGLIPETELEHFRKSAEHLHRNTDLAVILAMPGAALGNVAAIPAPWIESPNGIRDTEEWYISHALRRDYVYEVYDRQTDISMNNLKKVYEAVGNNIEILYLSGSDFGTQRGPLFSPEMFRDLYKPFFKRMCGWIHANTAWKVMIHSCGGNRPLMEDIIDAGIDIFNPVQCSAEGMEPNALKRDFGNRITFWGGGVDTQQTLPFGTPEEVYTEVRERIRIFNRGGGFVFNTIHNIQTNTPTENILAMKKAVEDSV
ncbi:MAG: uroporphyrinogen decarboxylase family protein [Candidatus Latescibacterota bacterium]